MKTLLACSLLAVALFSQADGHCGTYTMTATCDDYMTVYFDGVAQPWQPTNDEWWNSSTYEVPWYTREITIKCEAAGGPTGVLAYFDGGRITDGSWYCAPIVNGECPPGPWPAAVDYGAYGTTTGPLINYGVVNGMPGPDSPHWIWTDAAGPAGPEACCKMYSRIPGFCSKVTVDDYMELYFDGIQVPHEPDFDVWNQASTVCMPWNTEFIAIHGRNENGPSGILGTFANDVIMTDGTWECSTQYNTGWTVGVGVFPAAVDHGQYDPPQPAGPIPYGPVAGMTKTPGLDWIWTDKPGWLYPHSDDGDEDVYCRKDIRGAGYWMTVTCDDILHVYFDGVEVPLGPRPDSMNLWYEVTVIFVPWNTQVIGMTCHNGGGPSGFLAYFSNGLITDDRWSCIDYDPPTEEPWTWYLPSGPAAEDYGSQPGGRHSGVPYRVVPDMPDDPHWIWTYPAGHQGHRDVYCWIDLGCDCYQHGHFCGHPTDPDCHYCYCP